MHNTKKDKNKAINKLVLVETVEGLVPLVYALGLIMAFYGPNAKFLETWEVEYGLIKLWKTLKKSWLFYLVCLVSTS